MGSFPDLSIIKGSTSYLQPNSLHRLFEDVADSKADDIALIYEGKFFTYIRQICNYKLSQLS